MSRDSGGTYTRPNNSFAQPVNGTVLNTTHADEFFGDLEDALTDSLSKSGKGGMTADLDMNDNDINEVKTAQFKGSSTGTTTLQAEAVAGTTVLTLPAADGTLATRAYVDAAVVAGVSGVASINTLIGGVELSFSPTGRLTLASATTVMVASQAAKTIMYYTPFIGSIIPICDGTNMVPKVFTELSVATTDTTKNPAAIGASKVNDWFVWEDSATVTVTIASPAVVSWTGHGLLAGNSVVFTTTGALPTGLSVGVRYYVISSGLTANAFQLSATAGGSAINTSGSQSGTHTLTAVRLAHGPNYTDDNTRSAGTALVMVKGVLLNNASITNGPAASRGTYVGTTRSDSSSQLNFVVGGSSSGGTAALLHVWNAYNRVQLPVNVIDNGTNYSYTGAGTIRQARASAGMQVSVVVGALGDAIPYAYKQSASMGTTSGLKAKWGVGLNSTTTFYSEPFYLRQNQATNAFEGGGPDAGLIALASIGVNVISGNETSETGAVTFNINNTSALNVGFWY